MELAFHANDVVTIFGEVDYDGFYHGEINGIFGLVPSNFLKPAQRGSTVPGGTATKGEDELAARRNPRPVAGHSPTRANRGRSPRRRERSPKNPVASGPPGGLRTKSPNSRGGEAVAVPREPSKERGRSSERARHPREQHRAAESGGASSPHAPYANSAPIDATGWEQRRT